MSMFNVRVIFFSAIQKLQNKKRRLFMLVCGFGLQKKAGSSLHHFLVELFRFSWHLMWSLRCFVIVYLSLWILFSLWKLCGALCHVLLTKYHLISYCWFSVRSPNLSFLQEFQKRIKIVNTGVLGLWWELTETVIEIHRSGNITTQNIMLRVVLCRFRLCNRGGSGPSGSDSVRSIGMGHLDAVGWGVD